MDERTAEFEERWAEYVRFMNEVRKTWDASSEPYRAEVQEHFFRLLNNPITAKQGLSIAHGVKALERIGVPAKDAGFVMFIFFVAGTVWGNRGEIPKHRDEAAGKAIGSDAVDKPWDPGDLQ